MSKHNLSFSLLFFKNSQDLIAKNLLFEDKLYQIKKNYLNFINNSNISEKFLQL